MSERAIVTRRFMPPDSGSTRLFARSESCTKSSSSAVRCLAVASRDVEVAAVDDQVLLDGELTVELVLLRHDADAARGSHDRAWSDPCRRSAACRRSRATWPRSCASSTTCRRRSGRGSRRPRRVATSTSMPSTARRLPNSFTSPRAEIRVSSSVGHGSGSGTRTRLSTHRRGGRRLRRATATGSGDLSAVVSRRRRRRRSRRTR